MLPLEKINPQHVLHRNWRKFKVNSQRYIHIHTCWTLCLKGGPWLGSICSWSWSYLLQFLSFRHHLFLKRFSPLFPPHFILRFPEFPLLSYVVNLLQYSHYHQTLRFTSMASWNRHSAQNLTDPVGFHLGNSAQYGLFFADSG